MMNNKIIAVLVLAFIGSAAFGQQKMGRYHKNLLYEADIYFVQGDYYYASELYAELTKVAPDDPEVLGKLGICYFHLPPLKSQAERYLEMAVDKGDVEAKFYLAKKRIAEYRFFDALALIANYEQEAKRMKSLAEIEHLKNATRRAIQMVQAPAPVTILNLGDQVNSEVHDYSPIWDSAGNRIYFTSRRRYDDNSEKDFSEQYDENIFSVDLSASPLKATGVAEVLNTRTNDAAVACSPNGNSLMIYRTSKDGYSGDLYLVEKKYYAWGEPIKLDEKINSKHQEASACFGNNDGTILYFSSDRPGGFGGKDIYKVVKLPDGSWSQPENLGENINTAYDEDAPFISADGSLYFASRGHETMGGFDIFCAANTGGEFNAPLNVGYPINTPGDDIFFTLDPTGTMAYFSSERIGGFGLQDIYQVVFDEASSVIFKGELVNGKNEVPTGATVTLLNDENGNIEGLYQTDPDLGTFVLALNTNKKYTVLVEADGYKTLEKPMFFGAELNGIQHIEEKFVLTK